MNALLKSLPTPLEANQVCHYLSDRGYFAGQKSTYESLVNALNPWDGLKKLMETWQTKQFDLTETNFDGLGEASLDRGKIGRTLEAIEHTCHGSLKQEADLLKLCTMQSYCLDAYRSALNAVIDRENELVEHYKQLSGNTTQGMSETAKRSGQTLFAAFETIRKLESEMPTLEQSDELSDGYTSDMSTED